eukprot:scaffold482_cov247-Pinguiococcus_pyrenoidosus.AAC.30
MEHPLGRLTKGEGRREELGSGEEEGKAAASEVGSGRRASAFFNGRFLAGGIDGHPLFDSVRGTGYVVSAARR